VMTTRATIISDEEGVSIMRREIERCQSKTHSFDGTRLTRRCQIETAG